MCEIHEKEKESKQNRSNGGGMDVTHVKLKLTMELGQSGRVDRSERNDRFKKKRENRSGDSPVVVTSKNN